MESMRKGIALEYKRTNLKDEGQIKDSDASAKASDENERKACSSYR